MSYDPAAGPPVVTLDEHGPVTLERCSPTRALALIAAAQRLQEESTAESLALGAAALWLCWPRRRSWPAKPAPRTIRLRDDVMERGADLLDSLLGAGHSFASLVRPLSEAMTWAGACTLTAAEVQAARDFSAAPEGG